MDPIIKLMQNCLNDNIEAVTRMTHALGIKLNSSELEFKDKHLVKTVFMKWLNAGDSIMEMIVTKLPSPKTA